jgi:hypothetical protein
LVYRRNVLVVLVGASRAAISDPISHLSGEVWGFGPRAVLRPLWEQLDFHRCQFVYIDVIKNDDLREEV